MQYMIDVESAVWKIIDGEAVVVHSDSSEYFGLNASGTALWQVLATSKPSTEQLATYLADHFDREPEVASREAESFVAKVLAAGLISEAVGDPTATDLPAEVDGSVANRSGPYEPPELVKFGDLATLVLSGE